MSGGESLQRYDESHAALAGNGRCRIEALQLLCAAIDIDGRHDNSESSCRSLRPALSEGAGIRCLDGGEIDKASEGSQDPSRSGLNVTCRISFPEL